MINIVLYEPEIPGNTGNIMRTCAGTNTKLHLIKPLGFKLDEASIKRSGVNYVENCQYEIYENWTDFSNKNEGSFFFLTRYSNKKYSDVDYQKFDNIYLIFGKESTGIPKEILKNNLDQCLRIPANDKIRSLNLSNCAALVLYEVLRQKDFLDLLIYDPHKGADYLLK